MPKQIIINAMAGPWTGEIPEGAEVWGINRTFNVEPRLDRTYFFDGLQHFSTEYLRPNLAENKFEKTNRKFSDEMNELADRGVRVISCKKWPEIPKCELYPIDEVVQYFKGIKFFTCSVPYLIAQAIMERPAEITLNGMYHEKDSQEYMFHIYCVNFWAGIALGMGIKMTGFDGSLVGSAFPWESNLYGYQTNTQAKLPIRVLAASYQACHEFPKKFADMNGDFVKVEDVI